MHRNRICAPGGIKGLRLCLRAEKRVHRADLAVPRGRQRWRLS